MKPSHRRHAGAIAATLACGLAFACTAQPAAAPAPASSSSVPSPMPSPPERTASPRAEAVPFRPEAKLVKHGPRTSRVVALTFDADMSTSMLDQLRSGEVRDWIDQGAIQQLRRTGTHATIFVTGLWAKTYPDLIRSFDRDHRFEVANHSWDHAAFRADCYGLATLRTPSEQRDSVSSTARIIEKLTGERPRWFRFPGGCYDPSDLRLVASLGEQAVGWDVVSGDAFGTDPRAVADAVIDGVEPGSIVVMHLNGAPNAPATAEALREIIPALRQKGYRFVTLSELLLGEGA